LTVRIDENSKSVGLASGYASDPGDESLVLVRISDPDQVSISAGTLISNIDVVAAGG
jgi:hypothetical protein